MSLGKSIERKRDLTPTPTLTPRHVKPISPKNRAKAELNKILYQTRNAKGETTTPQGVRIVYIKDGDASHRKVIAYRAWRVVDGMPDRESKSPIGAATTHGVTGWTRTKNDVHVSKRFTDKNLETLPPATKRAFVGVTMSNDSESLKRFAAIKFDNDVINNKPTTEQIRYVVQYAAAVYRSTPSRVPTGKALAAIKAVEKELKVSCHSQVNSALVNV